MSTLKEKTAQGLLWGGLSNGLQQLLNLVIGIFLARRLSEADYGMVGMVTIFTALGACLQEGGFISALNKRKDATHRDFNAVFYTSVAIGLAFYALIFFCAPLISWFYGVPELTPLTRYVTLSFVISSFSTAPRAWLFRNMMVRETSLMTLIALATSGVVAIAMAYGGMAYWGIATQNIVYISVLALLSFYFSKWRPSFQTSLSAIYSSLKPLMAFSCKMLFTYIFNNINNNIFSLLLGRLYNKTEAGIYSQAQKWNVMGSNTITGMVQGVAQPTLVQVGDDKERLCRAFSKMLRFTCFISFPAMLGLALIAQEFIIITVTEKWLPSASLMQLLCIAGAFLPLATLYYNMIISRGKSDIYMWNVIIQGCVILGSLLTVHYLGGTIRDMVIAYVIVVISWTLVWHFFVNREIGFSWYQALKDILPFFFIAAFTMAVTHHISLLITEIPLYLMLVRIFLAAIIYLGIIYLSGAKILRQSWEYIRHKQV